MIDRDISHMPITDNAIDAANKAWAEICWEKYHREELLRGREHAPNQEVDDAGKHLNQIILVLIK